MIADLPTNRILIAITVTDSSKSFTYKMAAKINWHRYGTKLRNCHPMCIRVTLLRFAAIQPACPKR